MKSRPSLRSFLALSGSAMLLVSQSQAAYYYWDTNGNTAGLADTAGTWGSSAFMALVNAPNGRGVIGGTLATAATVLTSNDSINFGTINLGLTGAATTIGTTGTLNINNITFGFGQAEPVTLSGGGIITMGGSNPAIYVNNAPGTIAAEVAGTAGMNKAGPGILTLTGANTYTGTTSVTGGGTLNAGNGTSGNLNNTTPAALTFNSGGGIFNIAQANTSSQAMGALTFTAGHGTVTSTAASGSATQTVTFASLAMRNFGATGNFSLATNTNAAGNKIVLTDTTNAPLDSGSNDAGLYFGGTGYTRYDSVNGYFRAVIYGTDTNALAPLSGANMGAVTSAMDVKLNGNITAQTTAAVNTIHLDGKSLSLQDGGQVLDVNGILSNGGSIAAVGTLQGTTGSGEIVFNVTGGNLSVAPTIQDSRLTKTGAGTLTLSGANTYTGITSINSGTLAVSGGSAIEDTGAIVLANTAGATFQLNASETIGNLSGGGFSGGVVDVQGNTLTFGDSGNQLFGGTFTGTAGGAITKQGSGTLSLSNVNTFPGTINLNSGTLTFTLGNSGTTSAQSLSSGGAINMAESTTMTFLPTNQVALGQNTGNAISQLVAPNGWTIDNSLNITSGTATFRFYQNGNRWNFTGGVTGGTSGSQTLNILQGTPTGGGGDTQDILFSGVIQDGAGGTLGVNADFTASSGLAQTAFINLSGANTFTGPLSVANTRGMTSGAYLTIGGERTSNSATVGIITGSGSLGTVSPGTGNYTNTISLATGTILNYASSANQTLAGDVSGAGQILKQGAGTLTLTGNNTYTGATSHTLITTATTIRAGTLSVGSLNSVGGGSPSSNLGAPTTVANGTIAIGVTTTTAQLTYTGNGETTDRVINLAGTTGGATIDQSGVSGLLKFTSNLTATGNGIKTLTLQGSTGGTGELAGNIVNSTSATSVTKTGSGTWTLSGANSYTGATNVNEGTLALVGGSQTSAITVASGATLGFTTGSATTSTATVTFNPGHKVKVSGSVNNSSDYQLMSAASFNVTPTLDPAIPNYTLELRNAGTELWLKYTGGSGITFANWRTANGAGSQTLADDHDGDGVDNGTEFFLGGDTNTTGFTALPPVVNTGGTLSVTWTKHANYTGAYTTNFVVETSETLAEPWTAETVGVNVTLTGNDVKYTFPNPLGTKKFARLKVTGPN